jgi:hypothetical protein
MDIKKDMIEQKDHLYCIWEILECQQKKIIKGKAFIISLFLTFLWRTCLAEICFSCFCMRGLSSHNRMVCFHSKAFLKSDTVAGLTRS